MVVIADASRLFQPTTSSTQYPPMRPFQIASLAFLYGKPVGYFGEGKPGPVLEAAGFAEGAEGVYVSSSADALTQSLVDGLKQFKFTKRFPLDAE